MTPTLQRNSTVKQRVVAVAAAVMRRWKTQAARMRIAIVKLWSKGQRRRPRLVKSSFNKMMIMVLLQ